MNLHGYLAQNGIAYESDEALDFANTFFAAVHKVPLFEFDHLAASLFLSL